MKRAVYVIGALAALIAAVFPTMSEAGRGPGFGEMHTSIVEGDVLLKTRDTSDWVPASINMPLREGDRIWVPQGGRGNSTAVTARQ